MDKDCSERGDKAGFDPVTGEVRGSGSGAGGGNYGEDYDADRQAGAGADPVQAARSDEASPEETTEHGPTDPDEGRHR